MQAVIFGGPGIITVEEDRPIPAIQEPSDVIVKVTATALCGSDLHYLRGLEVPESTGFIMGHEVAGVVDSVGSAVRDFVPGDRVVSPFTTSCGECWFCQAGYSSRCVKAQLFGSPGLNGGQAEYVRVPLADSTLVKAPFDLPDELLVVMGDIMPTGHHAASNARAGLPEHILPEAIVVVIGCGPVGICAITSAAEWVPKGNLYAVDSVQERLDQAERHGAIPINLNAKGAESALEILQARTEGRGADAVLEVVGLKPAYDLAISLVRPFGFISSVGVHNSPSLLSGPDTYDKNLRGSWGRCPVRSTFPEALEVLRRNKELFLADSASGREGFVSHWMRLSEAPEAYKLFEQRKVRKVVFRPDKAFDEEEARKAAAA